MDILRFSSQTIPWRTRRSLIRNLAVGASAAAGLVCFSAGARAQTTVLPGYDLFETDPLGTFFNFGSGPVPLVGVPLGTFDFGGSIGTQTVGNTDTIIQRLSTVTAPSGTTSLLMNALDMETATPINLGAGLHDYFITLQSDRGGPASTGTMTINFNPGDAGGTFDSSLDVFFDVRQDSLTGPIVNSSDIVLSNTGTDWTHLPPPGALLITGVDSLLNGNDHNADFFPVPPFAEAHPGGVGVHQVVETGVSFGAPEPGSLALLVAPLASLGMIAVRRRRRAA